MFFDDGYKVLRGGSLGDRPARGRAPRSATGTTRSAGRSSPASAHRPADVSAPGLRSARRARCTTWSRARRTASTSSPGRRASRRTARSTSTASASAGTSTGGTPRSATGARSRCGPTRRSPRWRRPSPRRCVLAAVRSATPGTGPDESAAAPFTHDRWLLSATTAGWTTGRPPARRSAARAAEVPDALAPVDSALLFGLAVGGLAGRRRRSPTGSPRRSAWSRATAAAG